MRAAKQLVPKPVAPESVTPEPVALKPAAPKQVAQTPPQIPGSASTARNFDPLDYMNKEELLNIDKQFAVSLEGVDTVLFWTGVEWAHVQKWASKWRLKTLTIAMGPLMDPANPKSPKALKRKKAYSKYVKGASGRFAQYAREHCRVVVLTNPPPNIYSSRENNTYQRLEEPILKGHFGNVPVRRVDYLHPTVDGAAHVTYQTWPCDKSQDWAIPFGKKSINSWKKLNWSYKSLVTTSQLDLKPLQKQVPPDTSTLYGLATQYPARKDHVAANSLFDSNTLANSIVNDRIVEHAVANSADITLSEREIDLIEKERPSAGVRTQHDESQVQVAGSSPMVPARSDNHLFDTRVHERIEQRELDDQWRSKVSNNSLTPAYIIKGCSPPMAATTVPVVSIDDIAIGAEVTIDISVHRVNKVFLYLTMKNVLGLQDWWKVRWHETTGVDSE
jgi:hypothetical protein